MINQGLYIPRLTLILIFSLIIFHSAYSQNEFRSFQIKYSETRTTQNKEGKSVSSVKYKTIVVADKGIKVITNPRPSVTTTILAYCGGSTHFFINNGKEYFYSTEENPPFLLDMGGYNNEAAQIKYRSDSTSQINGFDCRKALIETSKGEIEVWYSPDHKLISPCFKYFLNELKGLPVRMRYTERPEMVIGEGRMASIEFNLVSINEQSPIDWNIVTDKDKYKLLTDDQDRMQVYFRLLTSKTN
jgi:hypothetical protein